MFRRNLKEKKNPKILKRRKKWKGGRDYRNNYRGNIGG
jgi:hypothetical protein